MSFWKSPSSKIKIFRGVFGIVWIILKFQNSGKILNKRKQNRNNKKRESRTYLALTW